MNGERKNCILGVQKQLKEHQFIKQGFCSSPKVKDPKVIVVQTDLRFGWLTQFRVN